MRGLIGMPVVVDRQVTAERLLLQLAVGAAVEQLHVSYPRIELSESRARVPSFYALDLVRAATGTLPDHETLEERARDAGHATLAWPAPSNPADAIDDQEHDLAVLRTLLDRDASLVRGHAHYLLGLNEHLRRSVVTRWAHGQSRWSPNDGLIRVTPRIAAALAAQRLTSRAYSLSALQKFSSCPYQFALSAIFRLQPLERPEPLQRMDPLTRGSLFHEIQARFFRALDEGHELPVTAASMPKAAAVLERVAMEVAESAHDALAPAVERVWADEVASIRRDLHTWLQHLAHDGEQWLPKYFEWSFGQVPGERDERSLATDVVLEGGFRLRGAVDLIEEHRQTGLLRVTDHKTGRKPERIEKTIVGGGAVLQPVLYPMAVEAGLSRAVHHGRLFYCTAAGSFHPHEIPLNERTRALALDVLRVIDRAVTDGFLAPAPGPDACARCDFQAVCGPEVARRVARKPQDRLADLHELRKQS
jgi:RecB family exonuclease